MDPEISIIVTCYNYGNFISECLSSVQQQSFKSWECLIVDDGSTDDSRAKCESFLPDSRFRYHYRPNSGVSEARNFGMNNASGEFVICLDADDYISDSYLEALHKELLKDISLTLAYPKVLFFGEKKGEWILPEYSYNKLLVNNLIVVSALYRKTDFLFSGGYDVSMKQGSEDWEYWIRVLEGNKTAHRVSEAVLYYRIKANSKNAIALADNSILKSTYRYITKKHSDIYKDYFESPLVLYHQINEREWEYFYRPWKAWFNKLTGKRKLN